MVAWTLFAGESREAFRAALAVDDATWARARGWALSIALIALPYYLDTNPDIVERSRLAIDRFSPITDSAASGTFQRSAARQSEPWLTLHVLSQFAELSRQIGEPPITA